MTRRPDATVPATVEVGGHAFVVSLDSIGVLPELETRGITLTDRLAIVIDAALPDSQRREVLAHELFHAAWWSTPLRSTPAASHEELVVDALAPVVLAALRRNPGLVDYLLAKESA